MPHKVIQDSGLSRSEWLFDDLSDSESEICYRYEFARECPDIRLWKHITDPANFIKGTPIPPPLAERPLRCDTDFGRLVGIDLGFLMLIPEWPEKPWLSIAPQARKKYLSKIKKELWCDWYDADTRKNKKQTINPLGLSLLNCVAAMPLFGAYHNPERFEKYEIMVDWSMTDQALTDEFRLWLAQHRQKEPKQAAPKLKSRLEYLGLYRLVTAMGRPVAEQTIQKHFGANHRLYVNPRWDRAKATVRQILKDEFLNDEKVLRNLPAQRQKK